MMRSSLAVAAVATPVDDRSAGGARPPVGGRHPRWRRALLAGVGAAIVLVACASDSADQEVGPMSVGLTSSAAPYYDDGNLTLYEAQVPVELPVRQPTSAEIKALGAAPAGTPYPRAPFLLASDESVEIQYVIANADSQAQTVWLLIDPWNEFVRYRPGVTVVDDDETTPNLGYDLGFYVQANSKVQGTITTDDMQEIAIKLASTENVLASPLATQAADAGADNSLTATELANHIFDAQNRSNDDDPVYTPWIPPVIAGITGFDLGIRTSSPADVAVQIVMDVQDLNGNRFVTQGSSTKQIGIPKTVLSPPAARF
jgi:hypothetical protein